MKRIIGHSFIARHNIVDGLFYNVVKSIYMMTGYFCLLDMIGNSSSFKLLECFLDH